MRLPSLQILIRAASATLRRFPFVLLSAAVAAVGALLAIDHPAEGVYERLILVGALGLPLFFGLRLLSERRGWTATVYLALQTAGIATLLVFYLAWPSWSEQVAWRRFVQLDLAFHLLVAFLPFVDTDALNGFWHYNKALFLRFLTAALYSGVLFIGLAIALAAVDNLLGIAVEGETYLRLWVLIAFVFNTWFFLGGVPDDLTTLENRADYPVGLKVFSQYVLVPLVSVYLTILTIYLVKIIVTTEWPSGWIGYLVSSVSIVGILAVLLVHPVRERVENRWVRVYARGFYIALFPSIVMLALAIWKRIDQYGITENRYFLAVLTLWLAGIAVYYSVTRSSDIRRIPQSLCLLTLVTFLGPTSAYRVSERSQVNRLEGLLRRNEILTGERIREASGPVSFEDRKEISAVLRYLTQTHGTDAIEPWFGGEIPRIDTVAEGTPPPRRGGAAEEQARLLATRLGIDYVTRWEADRPDQFNFHAARGGRAIPIVGFEYVATSGAAGYPDRVELDGDTLEIESTEREIRLERAGETLVAIPLVPLVERLSAAGMGGPAGPVAPEEMAVTVESDRARVAVYFESLAGRRVEGTIEVNSWQADLYLTLKP